MNELMNGNLNNNFECMDTNQILAMGQQGIYIVLDRFQKQLEKIENDKEKEKKRVNIQLEELTNKTQNAIDIATSTKVIKDGMDGYMSASDFGNMFRVKIGSKRVGLLLRICGIAKKSKTKTEPYDSLCPKYAKVNYAIDCFGREHPTFSWNYSECLNKIDEWLKGFGLYEEFYKIQTNGEMDRYIKQLYERFRNGEFDS